MSDIIQAEYGQPLIVPFALWSPTAEDFATGLTPVAGDSRISIDGAAPANTANIFGGAGLGFSLPLSAAEMLGAEVTLHIVDTAPKAWLDKAIHILTYGHPLAHDPRGVIAAGTAQAGGSSEITLSAGDTAPIDFYVGCVISIRSGTGAGQSRVVVNYDDVTKVATTGPDWVITPDATSVYRIYEIPPTEGVEAGVTAALIDNDIANNTAVANVTSTLNPAIADVQARVPAALINGKMDSSVEGVRGQTLTPGQKPYTVPT